MPAAGSGALAVAGWWARMLLVYAPYRLCVLVGDTVQHDLHHIRPKCDWANSSWERNEELTGDRRRPVLRGLGRAADPRLRRQRRPRPARTAARAADPRIGVSAVQPGIEAGTADAERRPPTSVLLVDGTGRGHALCGLFVRTDPAVTVYYGPGCDVIEHPRIRSVPSISVADPRTALEFLDAHPVEFVFVSHIDALAAGFADELRRAGHQVVGPSAAAAALEASKARGKRFCVDHGIPVPEYRV